MTPGHTKTPTIVQRWLATRRQRREQENLLPLTLARLADLALVLRQRLNNPQDPLLCPTAPERWVRLEPGTWVRADRAQAVTQVLDTTAGLRHGVRVWLDGDEDPVYCEGSTADQVVALLAGVEGTPNEEPAQ